MNALEERLKALGACSQARFWAWPYDDILTAWLCCPMGDWLLWLAEKLKIDKRKLAHAACACARIAAEPLKDQRPLRLIELIEKWAGNTESVSLDQIERTARSWFPIQVASHFAAHTAAVCAAEVTYTIGGEPAWATAHYVAENAAFTTNESATAEGIKTARLAALAKCADIVREHIDEPTMLAAWEAR